MKFVSAEHDANVVQQQSPVTAPVTGERARKVLSGVSVVIPARNEEPTIGDVIRTSLRYCNEVLVVDGHSTDCTVEVARKYGVDIITDNGKGKGDAIRVGASAARYPIIV